MGLQSGGRWPVLCCQATACAFNISSLPSLPSYDECRSRLVCLEADSMNNYQYAVMLLSRLHLLASGPAPECFMNACTDHSCTLLGILPAAATRRRLCLAHPANLAPLSTRLLLHPAASMRSWGGGVRARSTRRA